MSLAPGAGYDAGRQGYEHWCLAQNVARGIDSFQSVGHVMLTNDRVGVTLSFLRQHRLQLVHRPWIDAECREVRLQHWNRPVLCPLHGVLKFRLNGSHEGLQPVAPISP